MEMAVHTCKNGMKNLVTGVMKNGEKPKENRKESYIFHVYLACIGPSEYENLFRGSEHYEVICE